MREQYWLPRSEWTITPLGMRRRQRAICKASQTSPALHALVHGPSPPPCGKTNPAPPPGTASPRRSHKYVMSANPLLVGGLCREILLQQIGSHGQVMIRISGWPYTSLACLGNQTLPLHAGGHGLAVVFVALFVKVEGQFQCPATALANGKGPEPPAGPNPHAPVAADWGCRAVFCQA